jgi:hypothetical protein
MSRLDDLTSHYEALGLPRAIALTVENVKKAYKKCCLKYHPDVTKFDLTEARARFIEVQNSYNILIFNLKKAGGELPANILTPAAFFSLIGMDELASQTQENIIEINLKRAAAAAGVDAKEGETIGVLDAKVMKKLTFWARGMSGDERVLDQCGHFTSSAIDNIMEMAWVYKTSATEPSKKSRTSFFDRLERQFSDEYGDDESSDPDYSERMFIVISEWVHENYVQIGASKWVHKTVLKERRGEIIKKLGVALLKLGADESAVEGAVGRAFLGSSCSLFALVDVCSEVAPIEKKLSPRAQGELKGIASKAGMSLEQLRAAVVNQDRSNPVLSIMIERAEKLFATEIEVEGALYKNLKEASGQLEELEKI